MINDEKNEKEEINEIIERQSLYSDMKAIEDEENHVEEAPNTHCSEIISPILALSTFVASLFSKFWYTALFGIIFSVVGLYVCKKKINFLSKWILIINILAFALCFFIIGAWIILFVLYKM